MGTETKFNCYTESNSATGAVGLGGVSGVGVGVGSGVSGVVGGVVSLGGMRVLLAKGSSTNGITQPQESPPPYNTFCSTHENNSGTIITQPNGGRPNSRQRQHHPHQQQYNGNKQTTTAAAAGTGTGAAPQTTDGGSTVDVNATVPFVPIHVDENHVIEGAKEILLVIRPHWDLNAVQFKKFTDGITNKLVGCFYTPPAVVFAAGHSNSNSNSNSNGNGNGNGNGNIGSNGMAANHAGLNGHNGSSNGHNNHKIVIAGASNGGGTANGDNNCASKTANNDDYGNLSDDTTESDADVDADADADTDANVVAEMEMNDGDLITSTGTGTSINNTCVSNNIITNEIVTTNEMPPSNNTVVLVRVYGTKTDLLIDRKAEMNNILLLHKYGFAPSLYATFRNGLVYDYVPGVTLNTRSVLLPDVWHLVARRMADMHRMVPHPSRNENQNQQQPQPVPMLWKKTQSFFDLVPERFSDPDKQARALGTFLPIGQLRDEFLALYRHLETLDSPLVFAHNDLLLGNVVYTESQQSVSFIDYEYADFNFQAFDIGNHFAEFAGVDEVDYSRYPSRDFQLEWLRVYLEAYMERKDVPEADVERLYVQVNQFSLASHFFWMIWSLIQAEHSTIDFDYLGYAFLRYNEYLAKKDEFLALEVQNSS